MILFTAIDRKSFIKTSTLFINHVKAQAKTIFKTTAKIDFGLKELKLHTNVSMEKMVLFYGQLLELPVLNQSEKKCAFQVGGSILSFELCNAPVGEEPFYHFAFNIPENKIREAEAWQLERTPLIEPPVRLKDLEYYSNNVVHFSHWNAHSIFFYDPAGNIVEYIARHSLNNSSNQSFSSKYFLCISEIGLVVDSVNNTGKQVAKHFDLNQYNSSSETFKALGDEQGLILFFDANTKANFGAGRKRGVYPTEILLNSAIKTPYFLVPDYPYVIRG